MQSDAKENTSMTKEDENESMSDAQDITSGDNNSSETPMVQRVPPS